MAAPTLPTTGAPLFQRDWVFEFDTSGTGGVDPVWAMCEAVTNSQFQPSAGVWTDATNQSGKGLTSEVKSGGTFTGSITFDEVGDPNDPTTHPLVQKLLHDAAEASGAANVLAFRVSEYDFNDPTGASSPRVYAYTGSAGIEYAPPAADVNSKRTAVVTLHPSPSGPLRAITHPYPAGAAVPNVTGIDPDTLAVAGGELAEITGNGFTGTTGVTIGGTPVTAFDVVSDTVLEVESPAHTAGSALPVVVTNASGASSGGPTVTYA